MNSIYEFCFFFSSRRRHTRFDCDWSSDVCSSDLEARLESTFGAHFEGVCQRSARALTASGYAGLLVHSGSLLDVFEDDRSEEHTSELQSQSNLVCRLLLEKKKDSYPETASLPSATRSVARGCCS